EGREDIEEFAALQKRERGLGALAEDHAHLHERLQRPREASARIARALGDARELPEVLGQEGDDAVGFPVGAGGEDEPDRRLFRRHARSRLPARSSRHNLDKGGPGTQIGRPTRSGTPWKTIAPTLRRPPRPPPPTVSPRSRPSWPRRRRRCVRITSAGCGSGPTWRT